MESQSKPKTNKKYFINIGILVIFTSITLWILLKDDFFAVINLLKSAHIGYLSIIIALMFGYYLLEGCILTVLAKMYKRSYPFRKGFLNGMIGVFFSGITPSASGGQFAQAYAFGKQGIKISNSASILFMSFIIYQFTLVFYVMIALIFRFNQLIVNMPSTNIFGFNLSFLSLTIIGFIINAGVIFGLFFLAYSKFLHRLIIVQGINFLGKLKIVKNVAKIQGIAERQVSTFKVEFTKLLTNYKMLLLVALFNFVKLTLYFSVPYFAARALNYELDFLNSVVLASYLYMITSYVPLPGASGGSEAFFVIMFKEFLKLSSLEATAIMLFWRFATFYLGLIFSAIVVVTYRESGTHEFVTMANPKIVLTNEMHRIKIEEEASKEGGE